MKFISTKRVFIEDDDDDGYSTDKEASTSLRKKADLSRPHVVKTTLVIRKNALENDEHTTNVSAHEVTCAACNQKSSCILHIHTTWHIGTNIKLRVHESL
jgi:hypothetical protein